MIRSSLALLVLLAGVSAAPAHFGMLFPSVVNASRDDAVDFHFQWGHPYEHQIFDAPQPTSLEVLTPDGKRLDLTKSLTKVTQTGFEGKKVAGYCFVYKPQTLG